MYKELTKKFIERTNKAVKTFGEYQLFDKGLSEIADIDDLINEFILLSESDAISVIEELKNYKYGNELISYILITIDSKIDIWSVKLKDVWFDNLFDLMPSLSEYY